MPCVSFLFFLKDFPQFYSVIFQFFTLELSFTIKPQFQLSFLPHHLHIPPPPTLWPFWICFSIVGTSVGEVFPRKHLKLSPLHVASLKAYLSLLLWTLSYESSFNHSTSHHCPFGNPTSYFDSDRIKPASQLRIAFVLLWLFPVAWGYMKSTWLWFSSTIWK